MNMKTDFNDLAQRLIEETFRDVATTLTLTVSNSVYDETTGESLDFDDDGIAILAIVGPFQNSKLNGFDLEVGDVRAILPMNTIRINNITAIFLQSDTVTHDNTVYTVVDTQKDPSESILTIQLRKA